MASKYSSYVYVLQDIAYFWSFLAEDHDICIWREASLLRRLKHEKMKWQMLFRLLFTDMFSNPIVNVK